MVAIAVRFPAGRYHATPWGRHVNEADVAWPPEPWRLLRALVAAWHRKADRERFPEPVLAGLVDALAERLPLYSLPPAVHAHSRHFMPSRDGARETRVLVFDAFCRVDAEEPLTIAWPGLELADDQAALLDHLLARLGYLGRAESWAAAERIADPPGERLTCRPDAEAGMAEGGAGPGQDGRTPIALLAPLAPEDYARERDSHLAANRELRKGKEARAVAATLPDRLLDALALDTADYQAAGWTRPPAARSVLYRRPAMEGRRSRGAPPRGTAAGPDTARFVLAGRPLPRIEDAVRIGELARRALMSRAAAHAGRANIPAQLTGRGPDRRPLREPAHDHAFFLPEDADGDGLIDHLVVHAAAGFDDTTVTALDALRRLTLKSDGAGAAGLPPGEGVEEEGEPEIDRSLEWRVALEAVGPLARFLGGPGGAPPCRLVGPARVWLSATPYLHPWYAKPGFREKEQIARECARRGLPAPDRVEPLRDIDIHGRPRRPMHFHRFRSRRGLRQPDRLGSLWRLTFPEAIDGPLALGFACHFGLGLFRVDAGSIGAAWPGRPPGRPPG